MIAYFSQKKPMTGILLAGGKSTRMGEDKAFLKFRGKYLYTYPLAILRHFCSEILISSSDERFRKDGFEVVKDEYKDSGPLGGIYSCLQRAGSEKSIVLSCDLPLVTKEFIEMLLSESGNSLICLGKNKRDMPEPLAGIYDKSLLPVMKTQLLSGNYKMSNLLTGNRHSILDVEKRGFDSDRIFFNVNSPSDIEHLKELYDK
jgi:molybdopterin-guanine dinucleotide biosynthesis protein A